VNKRRELLIALGAGALTVPFGALAQQQGKVWRIGFLTSRDESGSSEAAFRQGLRELGYVEGQNIVIEWRFAKGNVDLLPELAAELVHLKVDCLIAAGANSTFAAKQATNTISIVMGNSEVDPVRLGLVATLARLGGNITGFINISSALAGKRLELLKETLPNASRMAILWDPKSRAAADHVRETELAARTLGVKLQSLEVRDAAILEDAFRTAVKERAQGLIVVAAGLFNSIRTQIPSLAAKMKLPVIYTSSRYVLADGLMSYGSDPSDQYRRVATYVDRILKGTRPADLPVEQPTKFELIINLKAAKWIGLKIPSNLLARADKVIE